MGVLRRRIADLLTGKPGDLRVFQVFPIHLTDKRFLGEIPAHDHDFFEIDLIAQGTGVLSAHGRDFSLATGTLVLGNPYETHALRFAGGARILGLKFLPWALGESDRTPRLGWLMEPFTSRSDDFRHGILLTDSEDSRRFRRLLGDMEQEQRHGRVGSRETLAASLQMLLWILRRQYLAQGLGSAEGQERSPLFLKVLQEIAQDINGRHDLSSIAARHGVTAKYLSRYFSEHAGMPLKKFLIRKRLGLAQERLRGGDEPITSIALECGFNDLSVFNRHFKKIAGVSPRQFRQGQTGNARVGI
jgi:AraC-like DNA-binding protein